ncbi:MAG: DUF2231 domain-containing protein [Deltaproteobacteria bacterium]|nr:DUF2231 domain-containing protein [Deltaproteobacteria bacterium]
MTVVGLFVADILWRLSLFPRVRTINYFVPIGPFILSIIGVLILAVSGWIGGQLIYHHHVGVAHYRRYRARAGSRGYSLALATVPFNAGT